MSGFSPKNWKNDVGGGTPISATALVDLEERLAASQVDSEGNSNFVQLLAEGKVRLTFGSATLPASGGVTAAVTINHGLEAVPQAAFAIAVSARDVNMTVKEEAKKTLVAEGRNFTGSNFGATVKIYWFAIG